MLLKLPNGEDGRHAKEEDESAKEATEGSADE